MRAAWHRVAFLARSIVGSCAPFAIVLRNGQFKMSKAPNSGRRGTAGPYDNLANGPLDSDDKLVYK